MRGRGSKTTGSGSARGRRRERRDEGCAGRSGLSWSRRKTQIPRKSSFVKYLAQTGEESTKEGEEWRRTRRSTLRCSPLGTEPNYTESVRVGEHWGIGGMKEMTNTIVGFDLSIEDVARCAVEGG